MTYLIVASLAFGLGWFMASAAISNSLADDLDELERRNLELDLKRGWLR